MKYFIVGLHASGKQEVLSILKDMGVSCGRLFSNLQKPYQTIYNSNNYETYTDRDIREIFENNAYIFIQEVPQEGLGACKIFEGLSRYSYDHNDVFVLSPDQFLNIIPESIKDDICFIWLDGTTYNRKARYKYEDRSYNFLNRDAVETRDIQSFIKQLYGFKNSKVIYFNNEEPSRVATIIYSMLKHNDLIPLFEKNFN